jgi:hypothetical protein
MGRQKRNFFMVLIFREKKVFLLFPGWLFSIMAGRGRGIAAALALMAGAVCGIALVISMVDGRVELTNGIDGSLEVSSPTIHGFVFLINTHEAGLQFEHSQETFPHDCSF